MSEIRLKDESYKIVGACFEVYNQKGYGFTEPIYQACLEKEFSIQGIPFVPQPEVPVTYKGMVLEQTFRPDFICYGKIIVEIKSVSAFMDAHRAQILNYLHSTGFELGLLVNFGVFPKLGYERFVCNPRNTSAGKYEVLANRLDI